MVDKFMQYKYYKGELSNPVETAEGYIWWRFEKDHYEQNYEETEPKRADFMVYFKEWIEAKARPASGVPDDENPWLDRYNKNAPEKWKNDRSVMNFINNNLRLKL
jgi:hypothetical protein